MKTSTPKPLCVGTILTPSGLKKIGKRIDGADLAEIRMDSLLNANVRLEQLLRALGERKLPVLMTLRIPKEGGVRQWKQGERARWMELLLPYVDAIDVERASLKELKSGVDQAKSAGIGVVCSAHFIDKNPGAARVKKEIEALLETDLDISKLAVRLEHLGHLQELARFLLSYKTNSLALMGLGPLAPLSRQVMGALGSRLMYGYIDKPAAPGQPSLQQIVTFAKSIV